MGGVFLGPAAVVTIPSGGTVTKNFVVPYQSPSTLKGKITVTGVPNGVTVFQLTVLLCPAFAPFTGGVPSLACVSTYQEPTVPGVPSGTYDITGLPPGQWTAYPGYCTEFGCSTGANSGKKVVLVAGRTTHANLKTPYLVPSQGELAATVTVTGAPSGFADQVGISACQGAGGPCETYYAYGNNAIRLILPTASGRCRASTWCRPSTTRSTARPRR